MIKKLGLLLCLGLAVQAPMAVGSYEKESIEEFLKISAGAVCAAGMVYLIAMYPKFFGELTVALLRGLTDCHYCHSRHCYCYGHHRMKVTTYY